MENIKGEQTPSQNSQTKCNCSSWPTKYTSAYIFVQEVPRMQFIMIWARSNVNKQLRKLGLQI